MEKWKSVPGYEGLYEASTLGRIRTVEGKITKNKRFAERHWKSRILKTRGKQNSGYRASLWKDGKVKDALVARIVAYTFLGNPPTDEYTVNHIDGNRFNNKIENLEWMTRADNVRYGFEHGQYSSQKKISLIDNTSGEIVSFNSHTECNKFLNRSNGYIFSRLNSEGVIRSKDGRTYSVLQERT